MAHWVTKVVKHHDEWVKIVNSFGEDFYAEDIVQEVYLRIMSYCSESQLIVNDQVNKPYMYFVLRNTFLIMHRGYKPTMTSIDQAYNIRAHEDITAMTEAYLKIQDKIDQEVNSWHWYDQKVWHIYRDTGMSIRKLAKETTISPKSLFVTLKHCKNRIHNSLNEDYQDYINKEYELID
jgi:DNA-directed RNA polymerase specialized sigma24 family protein